MYFDLLKAAFGDIDRVVKSDFFQKLSILLRTCVTCSEVPPFKKVPWLERKPEILCVLVFFGKSYCSMSNLDTLILEIE